MELKGRVAYQTPGLEYTLFGHGVPRARACASVASDILNFSPEARPIGSADCAARARKHA
eukprot:2010927-Pleurochrysis_carterae.AAC.1